MRASAARRSSSTKCPFRPLSADNVDKTRAFIEAYNRRDFDAAMADFHPQVEWVLPPHQGFDSCIGPDQIRVFWEGLDDTFDELRLLPQEFVDGGDRVAVRLRHYGRGRGSGAELDTELYHQITTFEDGMMVRIEYVTTWSEALEAAMGTPTFYFDFNSPYAYLAAERIGELIPDAEWRPVAFPIMLAQMGRLEEALKRDFERVRGEVSGRAAERGLPPFNPPQGWPIETWSLAPARAAVFAGERGRLREFTGAAFAKFFAEGRSLLEPDNLRDAVRKAGLDPAEVDEAIGRPEIKQRLKDNTEEALARGVTGIPTVAIGDELYWGDDRLEEAAAAAAR